jgi:hypothetical protein
MESTVADGQSREDAVLEPGRDLRQDLALGLTLGLALPPALDMCLAVGRGRTHQQDHSAQKVEVSRRIACRPMRSFMLHVGASLHRLARKTPRAYQQVAKSGMLVSSTSL